MRLEWKVLVHENLLVWKNSLLNLVLLLSFFACLGSTILLLENVVRNLLLHLLRFILKNEFLFIIHIAFEVDLNSYSETNITESRYLII